MIVCICETHMFGAKKATYFPFTQSYARTHTTIEFTHQNRFGLFPDRFAHRTKRKRVGEKKNRVKTRLAYRLPSTAFFGHIHSFVHSAEKTERRNHTFDKTTTNIQRECGGQPNVPLCVPHKERKKKTEDEENKQQTFYHLLAV